VGVAGGFWEILYLVSEMKFWGLVRDTLFDIRNEVLGWILVPFVPFVPIS
jgi:hypothetical protein